MIEPIGITTYSSFTEWRFLTAMSTKTTTTKNRVKSHTGYYVKYTPPTPSTTSRKADNGVQKD